MSRWLRSVVLFAPFAILNACGSTPTNSAVADAGVAQGDVPSTGMDVATSTDTGPGTTDTGRACNGLSSVPMPPAVTTPEDQIGPAEGEPLPNLQINQARMRTSIQIQTRTFAANACEVMEGCTMPGRRRLMRFDLETPNNGEGDLNIGPATRDGRARPQFEFAACHRHYHFLGYADYRLYNGCGEEVGNGHKQSFCLEDSRRTGNNPNAPTTARYGCNRDQGIQAGWSDVYGRTLDCQYVDITDVPPGTYYLQARINTARGVRESDYTDNVATVEITIPAEAEDAGVSTDPTHACAMSGLAGTDRDCGWDRVGTYRCTPGQMVTVGCDASCAPALGSCEGDSILRVCPGTTACSAAAALAANDDSGCGTPSTNQCSRVTFACPASGQYTLLSGAYTAGQPYVCIAGGTQ